MLGQILNGAALNLTLAFYDAMISVVTCVKPSHNADSNCYSFIEYVTKTPSF